MGELSVDSRQLAPEIEIVLVREYNVAFFLFHR